MRYLILFLLLPYLVQSQTIFSSCTGCFATENWVLETIDSLEMSGGSSLWSQAGSNIYYNNGRVGIFDSSPEEELTVVGTGKFTDVVITNNFGVNNTSPLYPIVIGSGGRTVSSDPQIVLNRLINSGSGNAHGFVDATDIERSGTVAYNSFDARGKFSGSEPFDHYAGFQENFVYASTDTMLDFYAIISATQVDSGHVGNVYGVKIDNVVGAGNGTVENRYAFYCDNQTFATNNYAFYNAGDAESVFNGNTTFGTTSVTAASGNPGIPFYVFGEGQLRQSGTGDKEMLTLYQWAGTVDDKANLTWKMGTASKSFAKIGAGYNSGADGFITFQTSADNGTSVTDRVTIMPYGGLKIHPQSAAPTSPELGMLYVDSDDSNLYFYNGSTWEQISP